MEGKKMIKQNKTSVLKGEVGTKNNRIVERNKIHEEIHRIQKCIQTDENTISRFSRLGNSSGYESEQIRKLTIKNESRREELEALRTRSKKVSKGLLDEEIATAREESNERSGRKAREAKEKKMLESARKKEQSALSLAYHRSGCDLDREARSSKKDEKRSYDYFLRACNSVPDYMLRKLENMPSNKGYIWRKVHCYGKLKARPGDPIVMFERRNDTLIIHKTTPTDYEVWHKVGKNREKLQYSEKRKLKSGGVKLFSDYLFEPKGLVKGSQ